MAHGVYLDDPSHASTELRLAGFNPAGLRKQSEHRRGGGRL